MIKIFLSIILMVILFQATPDALAQDQRVIRHSPGLDKATTLGKYITAVEASKRLRTNTSTVLLDVRPIAAYYYLGHPRMAHNIPLNKWTGRWDPKKNRLIFLRNPLFVERVVTKFADKRTVIFVMSKFGVSSAMAVDRLAEVGYVNAYNIIDGHDGWLNAALPLTRNLDPKFVYIIEPSE